MNTAPGRETRPGSVRVSGCSRVTRRKYPQAPKLSAPYRGLLRHYLFTRPRYQLESLLQKELL